MWLAIPISEKTWESILRKTEDGVSPSKASTAKSSTSERSSTSSLSYQRLLTPSDMMMLDVGHRKLNNKWTLGTGRAVEDVMFEAFKNFKHEHLSHSYVLDINDDIWSGFFTEEEMKEIKEKAETDQFDEPLPKHIYDCLSALDKKTSFAEIYSKFKDMKADRYDEPELYWCIQSILDYVDLFNNADTINIMTEQDLLDDVYGFIKKRRALCQLTTTNAASSLALSEAVNKKRRISGDGLGRQKTLIVMTWYSKRK